MNAKLALVESIECIKEKISSQEYKEILVNLAKVFNEQRPNSDSGSDSGSDERRKADEIELIPNIEVNIWNGTEVVHENLRTFLSRRCLNDSDKLVKISIELSTFIGIPETYREDILVSKQNIARSITKYIVIHGLQNPENKRIIDLTLPGGEELRTLLKVPKNIELTFFNLLKYLKVHYQ